MASSLRLLVLSKPGIPGQAGQVKSLTHPAPERSGDQRASGCGPASRSLRNERTGAPAKVSSLRLLVLSTFRPPSAWARRRACPGWPRPVSEVWLSCCMNCSHLPRRAPARGQESRAPNSLTRVQKTFSAGPCSFSCVRALVRRPPVAGRPRPTPG
jgi:hypothetical protein